MLQNQIQALQRKQEVDLLQLREREMELLRNNYNQVLVMVTLLMYPSYETCINFHMPGAAAGETVGSLPEMVIITSCGMAFCMVLTAYCIIVATAAAVLGPEMIIRGAQGASNRADVALVMNRGIAGMRIAKYHIYGSFGLLVIILGVFFILGAMHRVGFWARKGQGKEAHIGASCGIGLLMVAGYVVTGAALRRSNTVFSSHRLLDTRCENPHARCVVCGSRHREGFSARERTILCLGGCCDRGEAGTGFKCYQCCGIRHEFAAHQAEDGEEGDYVDAAAASIAQAAKARQGWDEVAPMRAAPPGSGGPKPNYAHFHPSFRPALPQQAEMGL